MFGVPEDLQIVSENVLGQMHCRDQRRFGAANRANVDRFADRNANETIRRVRALLRQVNRNV